MTHHWETAKKFVDSLANLRFDNAFNPYSDICPDFDRPNAAAIRRDNLTRVLEAALDRGVSSVWVARDLGYRGGRRTGLALTDESHLDAHSRLFGTVSLARSTNGPASAERTAKVVWRMLMSIRQPIFLWNVFPLHPHEPDKPMSNRCHTRAERQACRHIMVTLLELLAPNSILAIGRDAEAALTDLGIDARSVRHPSYGGQSQFVEGVTRHYNLPVAISDDLLLI